jgi:hypothetical protein
MKAEFTFALLLAASPATSRSLAGPDLLMAAGLTPTSSVADAATLYGQGKPLGSWGVEFLAKDSSSDAWLTFIPGRQVYVDCDEAPGGLPDDVIGALRHIATEPDWKLALTALQEVLKAGQPRKMGPGIQSAPPPDGGQAARAVSGADENDDDDDDDEAFFEAARTFQTSGYTIGVEACPRIKSAHNGNWHAAVIVTWARN